MLFRDINGKLVEINKNDFVNDLLYYQKIMKLKNQIAKSKNSKNINISKKTFDDKKE
jgi:hypothetical protein